MRSPSDDDGFDAVRARTKHALPMWVDSFLRDTLHLTAEHIGSYNLILYAMWGRPSCDLPNDDAQLAAVCRTTKIVWLRKIKPVIWPLLKVDGGVVFSSRLQKEAVFCEKYLRSQSDKKRGKFPDKSLKNNNTTPSGDWSGDASQEDPTQQPNNPTVKEGGGGSARDAENLEIEKQEPTFREHLLEAIGVDPVSGLTGRGGSQLGKRADMAEAERWLAMPGLTEALVLEEVRRIMASKQDGPPNTFGFFTKPMQRLSGALTMPPLQPEASRQPRGDPGLQRIDMATILAGINSDGSLKQ